MEKICPECGEVFTTNRSIKKYCTKECYYKSETIYGLHEKKCLNCGMEFTVSGGHRHRKYCCYLCSTKDRNRENWHQFINKVCPQCGKGFKVKGWEKKRFCSRECSSLFHRGKPNKMKMDSPNTKYKRIARMTRIDGKKVFVHRHLMEQHIGRPLLSTERVHHINGDPTDNRIDNLYLFENIREHQFGHRSIDKLLKPLLGSGAIQFHKGRYLMSLGVTWWDKQQGGKTLRHDTIYRGDKDAGFIQF